MKRWKGVSILLIFSILLWFSCGKQETQVSTEKLLKAKVTFIKGSAYLLRENNAEKVKLKVGEILRPGDVIITGKNSVVHIIIQKRGVLKIRENSQIIVDKLYLAQKGEDTGIRVISGKIVAGLQKLGKNDKFRITTSTAVAGVRGTSFLVEIRATKKKAFPYFVEVGEKEEVVTKIAVLTGKVELSDPNNPERKVLIEKLKRAILKGTDFENIVIEKITPIEISEIQALKQMEEVKVVKLNLLKEELEEVEEEVKDIEVKGKVKEKEEIKAPAVKLKETTKPSKPELPQKESKYLEDESEW